jgi:hypothetical protein
MASLQRLPQRHARRLPAACPRALRQRHPAVIIYTCHHRLEHAAQRARLVDDGTYKSQHLPLCKPLGGIQPIAIGEAWLRLAVLCAVHKCNNLGPSLAQLQLSVGISGAANGVEHALCSALHSHPDHILLSLDCQSAFNSHREKRALCRGVLPSCSTTRHT